MFVRHGKKLQSNDVWGNLFLAFTDIFFGSIGMWGWMQNDHMQGLKIFATPIQDKDQLIISLLWLHTILHKNVGQTWIEVSQNWWEKKWLDKIKSRLVANSVRVVKFEFNR